MKVSNFLRSNAENETYFGGFNLSLNKSESLTYSSLLSKAISQNSAIAIVKCFLEYTSLKYLRYYIDEGSFYLYQDTSGTYVYLTDAKLKGIIQLLLQERDHLLEPHRTEAIVKACKEHPQIFRSGSPTSDYVAVFRKGFYNLGDKCFTSEFDPEVFSNSQLNFYYDPKAKCPNFLRFLSEMCNHHQDRINFMRSVCYAVIFRKYSAQVFLSLTGAPATGKSTFVNILTALVGQKNVISTNLKTLVSDKYEVANLKGKSLILINDCEEYSNDLGILKQITGGDLLSGRKKYLQGSFDFYVNGFVILVTNHFLKAKDPTSALLRRIRIMYADKISKSRTPLFEVVQGEFQGILVPELPGIFNWVTEMKDSEAMKYLVHTHEHVPSLNQYLDLIQENTNPMYLWVKDHVSSVPHPKGTYLGFNSSSKHGYKGSEEDPKTRLYPNYNEWCIQNAIKPLGLRSFKEILMSTCRGLNYKIDWIRRGQGYFVEGLELKEFREGSEPVENHTTITHTKDEDHTVPFIQDRSSSKTCQDPLLSPTYPDIPIQNVPYLTEVHPKIDRELYEKYTKLLDRTELKDEISEKGLTFLREKNELAKELSLRITEPLSYKSEAYSNSIQAVLERGIKTILKFGFLSYKFKPLGISPRIQPLNPGYSLSSIKKILRNEMFQHMVIPGWSIIDMDLKSCFTHLALGLYPDHLPITKDAVESGGLWKYIQKEFESKGQQELYNKEAVKICVYSSFFQGGKNAMREGLIDWHRRSLGLTKEEFKNHPSFLEIEKGIVKLTSQMLNSHIIKEFSDLARFVLRTKKGEHFHCPTGHNFLISESNFRSSYSNYFQSYEFALLAQASLNTSQLFKDVQLLAHFHDGNTFMVPTIIKEEFIKCMQDQIGKVGLELELKYPQSLEVTKVWE